MDRTKIVYTCNFEMVFEVSGIPQAIYYFPVITTVNKLGTAVLAFEISKIEERVILTTPCSADAAVGCVYNIETSLKFCKDSTCA